MVPAGWILGSGCCSGPPRGIEDREELRDMWEPLPQQATVKTDQTDSEPSPAQEGSTTRGCPDSKDGSDLEDLPLCPMLGCSYAFLREFADSKGDHIDGVDCMLERPVERRSQSSGKKAMMKTFRDIVARSTTVPKSTDSKDSRGQNSPKSQECGVSFTMSNVCNSIIKPRTLQLSKTFGCAGGDDGAMEGEDTTSGTLSYAELGQRMGVLDRRGRPAFAKATHFVSHAWNYDFQGFVDAIGFWVEQSGRSEDDMYFWVDAFVVNQNKTQEYPQKWWSTRFMQAIGEIGNTVLVVEPWEHPVPLKRAWVIWELYCTDVTGARLHLAMNRKTLDDFRSALLDSFERVQTAMSHVDVSKSEAFHQRDQKMIHTEIRRTTGFTKMNALVQTRIQKWLLETAKSELSLLRTRCMPATEHTTELDMYWRLKDNLARMLRESGDLTGAESYFRSLHQEMEERLGRGSVTSLHCLNQLAVTLQKRDRLDEALEVHRNCLTRRRQVLGPKHEDTLQSASNMAVLLGDRTPLTQKDFNEARNLYKLAIEGRESLLGPDHPRTLYTLSNLGTLLSRAPDVSQSQTLLLEAEELHTRAATSLSRVLHEGHPVTLTARHNQACHWLAYSSWCRKVVQERKGEAKTQAGASRLTSISDELERNGLEQLKLVHTLRIEKLGKEHPDTEQTEKLLLRRSTLAKERERGQHLKSSLTLDLNPKHSYSTWAELSVEEFPMLNTKNQFAAARGLLNEFGVDQLFEELVRTGFVDRDSGTLTTGMQPFNVFARIASGVMKQPAMVEAQLRLGRFQDRFIIACNKPECDENWNSDETAWVGKASMSKRHALLLIKDLHWEWFNVLTYGQISGMEEAISRLEQMREAALIYTRATDGWPHADRVGLFLHVHAHSSVKSTHLHVLDMNHVGPTYQKLKYKNLRIDDAISVLKDELKRKLAVQAASSTPKSMQMALPNSVPIQATI
mmetsp:Transcript_105677/g.328159  ORF Transcript_105677/g.328159 Transcript_105677/m.328159 type:complete len:963 (+) Transcript_105677:95-2983(+)